MDLMHSDVLFLVSAIFIMVVVLLVISTFGLWLSVRGMRLGFISINKEMQIGFKATTKELYSIHTSINSRVDDLLQSSGKENFAAGREIGRSERGSGTNK
jgi:hypothetical protein